MIYVPPIPIEVLIHTAEYHEYDGSPYGEGFKAPITLEFVRVEPKQSFLASGTNETVVADSLLIYDTVNSQPIDVDFKEDSKIVFDGKEMYIKSVAKHYAFDPLKPHHQELRLI